MIVKFRLIHYDGKGLRSAPSILARELKGTLKGLGNRLERSAELRMRRDTGDEAKSLRQAITGSGLDYQLVVYSTLLKAFIDAYGMRPGTRIPYGAGSRLRQWANRKVRVGDSRTPRLLQEPYKGAGPNRQFGRTVQRITPRTRSRVVTKGAKVSIKEVRKNRAGARLSYLTAKAIFERGLRASYWNRNALLANKSRIMNDLKNAISRAVAKINRG